MVPVALAAVTLLALGFIQTRDALALAQSAGRARTLAGLAAAAVDLNHRVEQEYLSTNLLRQPGGAMAEQLVAGARGRTDAALDRFRAAGREAVAVLPGLDGVLQEATRVLGLLPAVRNLTPGSGDGSVEILDVYNAASESLIAVAGAAPGFLNHAGLAATARSAAVVAEVEHLAAEQYDLLRRVFTRQRLAPGELVQLAESRGGEERRLGELRRFAGPVRQRVEALLNAADVQRAGQLRDAVLDGGSQVIDIDPEQWNAAQSGLLRRLRVLQVELASQLRDDSRKIENDARTTGLVTGGATLIVVAAVLAAAGLLAVRTSRRMRRMRQAALALAHTELPTAVWRAARADDAGRLRAVLQEAANRIDSLLFTGSDEVGELGSAFGAVHRQALRLASDQALLRMELEAILAALSRRGQGLAQRQLHLIEQFGQAETDPQRLARLQAIDQLAARMRRNEENLLVLAGGGPGRRLLNPVQVADAISAAVEEMEDQERIEVAGAPLVAIVAHAAGDVIHVLAELIENAVSFSPPTTKVRVAARQTVEGVHMTVYDEGIGMPAEKLAEANQRLAEPSALTSTLVGTMGLLVVARLARRHHIEVRLSSAPGGGTAATVALPGELLAPAAAAGQVRRGRWWTAGPAPMAAAPPALDWPGEADRAGPGAAHPTFMGEHPTLVGEDPTYMGEQPLVGGDAPPQPSAWTSGPPVPPAPAPADVVAQAPAGGNPPGSGHPPASGYPSSPGHAAGDGPFTGAGLPRRVAGSAPWPEMSRLGPDSPHTAPGRVPPTPLPDPDDTRARLSSLVTGIAAAQRNAGQQPPTNQ